MTLGHFGGSTKDAALVEVGFLAGMLAGSGIWRPREGSAIGRSPWSPRSPASASSQSHPDGGPSLFAVFLPASFLMVPCPVVRRNPDCPYAGQIPPEYLGAFFGLYGTIMAWAMPMSLAAPSRFADLLGLRLWFVRLWSDHGTACDGYAACVERPKRGKRYRAVQWPKYSKKRRRPSVHASAFRPLATTVLRRHPTSRSLFVITIIFRRTSRRQLKAKAEKST